MNVAIRGSPISPAGPPGPGGLPGVPAELAPEQMDDPGFLGGLEHGPPSVASRAKGFSHITCLPAAMAARAIAAWVCGGVAIGHRVDPVERQGVVHRGEGPGISNSAARSAVLAGSRPTRARTSKPAARRARTWV